MNLNAAMMDPGGFLLGILSQEANKMDFFKWIGEDTFVRSRDGVPGAHLVPGGVYSAKDFAPAVIQEWIATGNAEAYVNPNPTDTKLDVRNVVVDLKSPKVGSK